MAAREMENDLKSATIASLPAPAGALYRTPSRKSKKPRRPMTPRDVSPSPPALPTEKMEKKMKRASRDIALDENVSFLDPRRFTPTLHASLVSEILSLRRDQEEKLKIIDVLETTLQNAYEEKAELQTNLSDTTKESRSLKRQLALLEGGTTSAIGDLSRERDEAVDANTETKKRLDNVQKKLRTQEEDSRRTHELWAKEKDEWAEERRKMERQLHIAESRLKQIIEEAVQLQAAQSNVNNTVERDGEETDGASVRSPRSPSVTNSIRFSMLSGPRMSKLVGKSLADELFFDDDDDQTEDGRQSVLWSPGHLRNTSGGSISDLNHRRNYSIDSQARPGSLGGARLHLNQSVLRRLEGDVEEDDEPKTPVRKLAYVDAAVQGDEVKYVDAATQGDEEASILPKNFEYADAAVQRDDETPVAPKVEYVDAAVQGDDEVLPPKPEYVDAAVQRDEETPSPPKVVYVDTAVQGDAETPTSPRPKYVDAAIQGDVEVPPSKKFEYVDVGVQGDEEIMSPKIEYVDTAIQADEAAPLPVKVEYVDATIQRNEETPSAPKPEYADAAIQKDEENSSTLTKFEYVDAAIQGDEDIPSPLKKSEYVDTGIQYSPPASPKSGFSRHTPEPYVRAEGLYDGESSPRIEIEIEANQRRKRVHISRPSPIDLQKAMSDSMVSSAAQTAEPLSPRMSRPLTERQSFGARLKAIETKSIATQTEDTPTPKKSKVAPLLIPSISIVPPTSLPPTPREPRLPQYFKDVGCQVSLSPSSSTTSRSTAVQTDEIRVDTRLNMLPRHLHPSTITSRPTSPAPPPPKEDAESKAIPKVLPPRNPRRLDSQSSVKNESLTLSPVSSPVADPEPRDVCLGGGDNGPMRRGPRISALFSGFDAISSEDGDDTGDVDLSDVEYRTALSAPNSRMGFNRRTGRASASVGSSSPEDFRALPRGRMWQPGKLETNDELYSNETRDTSSRKTLRQSPIGINSGSRASVMRKAAMIQNGIATHRGRSESPSQLETREPPFPIPTRASSRQTGVLGSAPSDGSRTPSYNTSGWYRRGSTRSNIYRTNSIRKVRSAAAIPRAPRNYRRDSYSTPPVSPSEGTVGSPELPPLPQNDITRPRSSRHRSNTANTDVTSSPGGPPQAVGVVDAIAQTMVGEWMFKYVRRRRSFGVADAGREENSNDRHKRWVWLAPYEQAILWSSKQPSSGSALMGKAGRKLTIKSVLDVKDDNPIPKGETQIFNRSILILTPQRALKFTASTAERHYLWIMALSFLAHSSQAVPQITSTLAPPSKAAPPPDPELSKSTLKRGGAIRDSIRLTKGRNPTLKARRARGMQTHIEEEPEPLPEFPEHLEPEITVSTPAHHQREPSEDPAEPPMIPRFHARAQQGRIHERANQVMLHGRRRSNTGGHVPPPLSFRGFSPTASSMNTSLRSPAEASIDTAGSPDMYGPPHIATNMPWGVNSASPQRGSDASSRPTGNFFEAIGTVRMEAFINPLTSKFDDQPDDSDDWRYKARRQSKERRRHASRSRHRDSLISRGARDAPGADEDDFRDDPFSGF